MKLRKLSEIRWYLYRSASKLNMLYDQLVASRGPFSGRVELGVPGVSASIDSSPKNPPTLEEKLELVEKQLRVRNLVGTLDSPGEYFAGTMRMRWGLFNDQGTRPDDEPPLVFFAGLEKEVPLIIGLGGSSKHVEGHNGASSTYSRSSTPALTSWLLAGLHSDSPPEQTHWVTPFDDRQEVMSAVAIALHYLRPPTQRISFLAKTLVEGTLHNHEHMTGLPSARVILGTPIYAYLAELPEEPDRYGLDSEW